MKRQFFFFFFLLSLCANAQQVEVYTGNNLSGDLLRTLNLNESFIYESFFCTGSFRVLNGAAVKIEFVSSPYPYPSMFIYSEENVLNLTPGTDQYCGNSLKITCLKKASTVNQLPQPTVWIPIDRGNVNGADPAKLEIGDEVLMLRRAFIWENSEDLGCCHGPYASLGLNVHSSNLLTDFNFNYDAIAEQYCEGGVKCGLTFNAKYPKIDGLKLPGPIFYADNPCNDFSESLNCFFIPSNPKSEWIDGPWGACYSGIPIFKWKEDTPHKVSLILREGDDTNTDDFLGGILIDKNKDKDKPIVFRSWKFGWIELEIKTIEQKDIEFNVDVADYYWFYNWDGANPEQIHSIPQTPPFDQFTPLANRSIEQMEATFPSKSTVGLLGGKFPTGTLRKPMIYKAACVPAVFK